MKYATVKEQVDGLGGALEIESAGFSRAEARD
jgi:hypothetical protein